jgi:hypothetical protein
MKVGSGPSHNRDQLTTASAHPRHCATPRQRSFDRTDKPPVDEIARQFRYEPLPSEVRVTIIAAWQRGGLLPAGAIEQIVPQISSTQADTGVVSAVVQ